MTRRECCCASVHLPLRVFLAAALIFCAVTGIASAGGAQGKVTFGTTQIFDLWNQVDDQSYEKLITNSDNCIWGIFIYYDHALQKPVVRSYIVGRYLKPEDEYRDKTDWKLDWGPDYNSDEYKKDVLIVTEKKMYESYDFFNEHAGQSG